MDPNNVTAYSFFEIAPTASLVEIRHAYRRMALKHHPDRIWSSPTAAASKTGMQEVNRWYDCISTPEARIAYDAKLARDRDLSLWNGIFHKAAMETSMETSMMGDQNPSPSSYARPSWPDQPKYDDTSGKKHKRPWFRGRSLAKTFKAHGRSSTMPLAEHVPSSPPPPPPPPPPPKPAATTLSSPRTPRHPLFSGCTPVSPAKAQIPCRSPVPDTTPASPTTPITTTSTLVTPLPSPPPLQAEAMHKPPKKESIRTTLTIAAASATTATAAHWITWTLWLLLRLLGLLFAFVLVAQQLLPTDVLRATQRRGIWMPAAARADPVTYYGVLGLTEGGPETSGLAIRQAYKQALRRHHPDKQRPRGGSDSRDDVAASTQRMLEIGQAYRVLGNPYERCRYDVAQKRWWRQVDVALQCAHLMQMKTKTAMRKPTPTKTWTPQKQNATKKLRQTASAMTQHRKTQVSVFRTTKSLWTQLWRLICRMVAWLGQRQAETQRREDCRLGIRARGCR